MLRWLTLLLVFAPVALIARLAGAPDLFVFVTSTISLIPLAGLIGKATEELANHFGARIGGLLNATFGNAAELIITSFALQRGLLTLVKASITGSIIGNTLLVLGAALLAGGLAHGRQRFNAHDASMNAAMMIAATAGLYLPATFAMSTRQAATVEPLSLLVAGTLLLTYAAYLGYTLRQGPPLVAPPPGAAQGAGWSIGQALLVLALAMVGTAVSSELLVGSVDGVTHRLGWSEFFIGVIIVPIAGNAAEHFSAVQMAWWNRLDVSFAIAAGSSTQIALLVAPALVLLSLALGHPMDLVFAPLELVILGLATAIFAYLSVDGDANWLEGFQLLAIYVMASCAFFFVPLPQP